ncbi:MAG: alpha-L-glutamate ligase [Proteobacteria bacterium]|nr:alpha-L-glutamate ligase [Pseudomonadota bacterium]
MTQIHILYENSEWTAPLLAELDRGQLPYRLWDVAQGQFDLSAPPPKGLYYSRLSASAHSRGHRFAPEYADAVIQWLEAYGRRVVNGSSAVRLELSKVAQYAALRTAGIATPRTCPTHGRDPAIAAARTFAGPFISKHNRGGKGLGVYLHDDAAAFAAWLDGPDHEPPIDGILLLQEYIQAPAPYITRLEFVGGAFLYAVRVDTRDGFQLCPAEACAVDPAQGPMFQIVEGFSSPLIQAYGRFLADNRISIAGIEFIVDAAGRALTYDINTNTNYNPEAEARLAPGAPRGLASVAAYLGRELADLNHAGDVISLA